MPRFSFLLLLLLPATLWAQRSPQVESIDKEVKSIQAKLPKLKKTKLDFSFECGGGDMFAYTDKAGNLKAISAELLCDYYVSQTVLYFKDEVVIYLHQEDTHNEVNWEATTDPDNAVMGEAVYEEFGYWLKEGTLIAFEDEVHHLVPAGTHHFEDEQSFVETWLDAVLTQYAEQKGIPVQK